MPAPTAITVTIYGATGMAYDITTSCRLDGAGYQITRGRGNETSQVSPGRLTLTVENPDGRFTLGHANAAAREIRTDQLITVDVTIGGTTYRRFTGYVEAWPTTWANDVTGRLLLQQITAYDRSAAFARRELRSMYVEEAVADAPVLLFPLADLVTSYVAAGWAGDPAAPLQVAGSGAGVGTTTTDFASVSALEGAAGTTFAGGRYLTTTAAPDNATTTGTTFEVLLDKGTTPSSSTAEGLASVAGATSGTVFTSWGLIVESDGTLSVTIPGGDSGASGVRRFTTTKNVCDGVPHLVHLWISGTSWRVYVDGLQTGSTYTAAANYGFLGQVLTLGAGGPYAITGPPPSVIPVTTGVNLTGSLACAALYDYALDPTEITDRAAVVANGGTSDSTATRMARIAKYLGLTASDYTITGTVQTTSVAVQAMKGSDGGQLLQQVADTEGAPIFVARDGRLTLQSRLLRVQRCTTGLTSPGPYLTIDAASTTDVDALDAGLAFPGDKEFLTNRVTGTRPGGVQQMVQNTVSITARGQQVYPTDLGTLLYLTDTEVLNAISWRLAKYSADQPARASSLPIDLTACTTATQQLAAGIEIGHVIRVSNLPTSAPVSTITAVVEGYTETLDADSWTFDFNVAPSSLFEAWVIEDPVFGALGSYPLFY